MKDIMGTECVGKKKIGLVVAIEMDAVLSEYGTPEETQQVPGYKVSMYENDDFILYAVDSGAGEISASAATQFLITRYGVDLIVNFGVVGALTEEMQAADLCVVERIIHYDFETTGWINLKTGQYPGYDSPYIMTTPDLVRHAREIAPSLMPVTCASADKYVETAEVKTKLRTMYDADICEMESAGIVLTCNRNQVPCLLIKAIADSLTGGGKEFFTELERASKACFQVVDQVIRGLK